MRSLATVITTIALTLSGLVLSPAHAVPVDPYSHRLIPTGTAWVDVPESERVYMINQGMVTATNWNRGDDVARYLPEGQSCTYSTGETFQGPKIYWS